ncbi:MAG: DUF5706 domain-containing protein [Cyanobacteria bacterium]|nr:DUF5706 domain-containing protein [Cyanobacteriota bacterium]MDA1021391.1 DUF5706 domain-containing protein [Cyanobacteriota bacterium]
MNTLFEFTKLSFENLNRHIRLADNKAKFILSLDLAVISGLITLVFQIKSFEFSSLPGILMSVAFIFIFFSFVNTVFIISPIVVYKCATSEMLYWRNIEKQDKDKLAQLYKNLQEDQMMDELVEQIYFYSFYASEKYRKVKAAIFSTLIAVFFALVAVLVLVSSHGLVAATID